MGHVHLRNLECAADSYRRKFALIDLIIDEKTATTPQFEYSFEISLKGFCRKLGINEIFSDHTDFSPVTKEWLRADKILHKAKMQVNEEGIRTAAITLVMVLGSLSPEDRMEFNRPFIYAIMNNTTCLPAFIGVVTRL